MSLLRRAKPAPTETEATGPAGVDRRTKDLIKRLEGGEIAVGDPVRWAPSEEAD